MRNTEIYLYPMTKWKQPKYKLVMEHTTLKCYLKKYYY